MCSLTWMRNLLIFLLWNGIKDTDRLKIVTDMNISLGTTEILKVWGTVGDKVFSGLCVCVNV